MYAPLARAHRRRRRRRRGAPRARGPAAAAVRRRRRPGRRRARAEAVAHAQDAAGDAVHCAVVLRQGGGLSLLACSSRRCSSTPRARCTCGCSPGRAPRRSSGGSPSASPSSRSRGSRCAASAAAWHARRAPRRRRASSGCCCRTCSPGVDRVVLLPLPSVATGDVAELADLDLGGHALAAPRAARDADGQRLRRHPRRGRAARATARRPRPRCGAPRTRRHAFDFDAFSADVLVLDLDRLRRDGFSDAGAARSWRSSGSTTSRCCTT